MAAVDVIINSEVSTYCGIYIHEVPQIVLLLNEKSYLFKDVLSLDNLKEFIYTKLPSRKAKHVRMLLYNLYGVLLTKRFSLFVYLRLMIWTVFYQLNLESLTINLQYYWYHHGLILISIIRLCHSLIECIWTSTLFLPHQNLSLQDHNYTNTPITI